MSSWRDLAAQRVGDAAGEAPLASFYGITGTLADNLRALERMRAPRGVDRRNWAVTVADAVALARDGWVEVALALGWSELDLFGIGPNDSWEFSGLAVWLERRSLMILDERMALAGDTEVRATFYRGGWGHGKDAGLPTPVPLWRFGRS